jgi:hypothetical protein
MISHCSLLGRRAVRRGVTTGVLAVMAAGSIGCGTKEAPGPLEPFGATGRIRFVNLITDPTKNPVNAILEKVPFGVNLGYAGSTPSSLPAPNTANYSAILTGDRSLVLKKTADTTVTVGTFTITIASGEDRTVYAIGGAGGGAVSAFSTTDTNSPAPSSTQTRVRVVNMSPTAGAIDVFVTAPNADLSTATPTVSNLAYQSLSAYLTDIAPGTYQFRAVPAGTAPANRSASVVINLASFSMAGTNGRTIVAADNSTGGSPLRAFVLTDQ